MREWCFVRLDDGVLWGQTTEELLSRLDVVLARFEERFLYTVIHKMVLCRKQPQQRT